jgi:hypothetical protein
MGLGGHVSVPVLDDIRQHAAERGRVGALRGFLAHQRGYDGAERAGALRRGGIVVHDRREGWYGLASVERGHTFRREIEGRAQ